MKNSNFRFYNAHPKHLCVDDCVKRTIAITTGMDYKLVAKELNEHKQVTGVKVFYNNPNPQSYVENVLGLPRVKISKKADGDRITAGAFAKEHPNGRYILSLSGHWTACVDGVIYDTWDCTKEGVLSYYEVTQFIKIKVEKKYCFCVEDENGNDVSVTVYDGNRRFATKKLSQIEGKEYIDSLYQRGFFNFNEMGEYI